MIHLSPMHACHFPRLLALLSFAVAGLATAQADVFIAEFDAINVGSATDADGNYSDWIELRNSGGSAVSLNGWALSDDPLVPGKWIFPNVSIGANAQLIIWASGKNWTATTAQLHTNFKLGDSGTIVLSQPDGSGGWTTISTITNYPSQRAGLSYGRAGSLPAGAVGFFETPTFNAVNGGTVVTDFVKDTSFSVNRGFYSAPFTTAITTVTPGATIIYTTNGSEPTLANGTQVPPPDAATPPTASVNITTTTILRARAVKSGLGATDIDTQTYIFPTAVLTQSEADVAARFGSWAAWGHDKGDADTAPAGPDEDDWSMDARVTGHSNPEDKCVEDDLKTIPTVSLVLPWADMFGVSGIYIAGESIDKRASWELINPDGTVAGANANTGGKGANGLVHIFGGSSTARWKTDKLSMRFNFNKDFKTEVLGDSAIGDYDSLVLDARLNQVWVHSQDGTQRNRGDYVRDAVMSDFENNMGNHGTHGQAVHVYINGLYWGLYTMHERPDDHFAASYLGGNADDYDVVKHNQTDPNFLVAGLRINPTLPISNSNHTAGVNYQALLNLAAADLSTQANFNSIAAKLDIPDFIRYMLLNFYAGNEDWAQHNWYASFNRVRADGIWRFHSWDAEHVFKTNNYDATGKNDSGSPTYIHQRLALNAEYRRMFADAAHKLIFNGGLFTPARAKTVFDARLMDINEAIRGESARWGDSGGSGATFDPAELHLRFSNVGSYVSWWNERLRILNTILDGATNRTTSLLSQLRTRSLYPAATVGAPVFSQHGGIVPANYSLTMTNSSVPVAGTIYFTQDGSDPRVEWTGAIGAGATVYTGAVTLMTSRTIKARVLNGTTWSALNEAYFSVGSVAAAAGNLVISKIHYRPAAPTAAEIAAGFTDRSDFEFIEVLNISNNTVSLDGISFGHGLDIAPIAGGVRELAPGGRALYVAKVAAFQFRYGTGFPIAGEFVLGSNLNNDGERLTLLAGNGSTIVDFTYGDAAPWPSTPDGSGPSLVLMQPTTSDPAVAYNWRASTAANGAPAADDRLTFAAWKAVQFTPEEAANAAISGPAADPDGDGLNNLQEFFAGTPPKSHTDSSQLSTLGIQIYDPGTGAQPYAVFSFRRVKAAEEVAFYPETTTTLDNPASWESASLVLFGNPIDHGDGTESRSYRAPQPLGTDPTRHFRLHLSLP
jgi:CotH kinase protein/Lamin Tail Domain/Chitobiase/beta-hexosaminidase C-terminal domain